jgi:hypothetical protein
MECRHQQYKIQVVWFGYLAQLSGGRGGIFFYPVLNPKCLSANI